MIAHIGRDADLRGVVRPVDRKGIRCGLIGGGCDGGFIREFEGRTEASSNGALGEKWNGLLLSCETGRNVVFGYLPKPDGAGFKLERFDFCTTNTTGVFKGSDFVGGANNLSDERHTLFRPSDVCVGADGAIYISDWFDKRTGGHQDTDETCSGTIYRIAPKGFKSKVPELKLDTVAGQIAALQSPATNVRQVAFSRLKAAGDVNLPAILNLRENANPYIAARAVWLLAQLGEQGLISARIWLESEDATKRLVALRAIRAAVRLPLVAIGGIHAGNAAEVLAAGADGLAVVSAIMSAADPCAAAQALRAAMRIGN